MYITITSLLTHDIESLSEVMHWTRYSNGVQPALDCFKFRVFLLSCGPAKSIEPSLSCYLPTAGEEIYTSTKGISTYVNAVNLTGIRTGLPGTYVYFMVDHRQTVHR